jgi:hypothetical protein
MPPTSDEPIQFMVNIQRLAEKIRKGQFKTGKLGGRTATVPEIWQAALAA